MSYFIDKDYLYEGDKRTESSVELSLDEYLIKKESERLSRERAQCLQYLKDTDWIYVKCLEEELDVNTEYADVVSMRKQKRARIQEIDSI